jgi:hypothetical protein
MALTTGRSAGNGAPVAEQSEDLTAGQGLSYSILSKDPAAHVEHDGSFFQAASR